MICILYDMYTIQHMVYSKHQHHKFWQELLGRGYLLAAGRHGAPGRFLGGGVLLAGWMRQRTCLSGRWRHVFWRVDDGVYFGRQTAACPRVF
jgi:hypothetical protein